MDMVIRGVLLYAILWAVLRCTGRRTIAQITVFDFILLLVIGEATQNALLGEDFTLTNAAVIIITLMVTDDVCTSIRARSKRFERFMEGVPVRLMAHGQLLREPLMRERVDQDDIMQAARHAHGIARLDQIEEAYLEPSGGISVIPKNSPRTP